MTKKLAPWLHFGVVIPSGFVIRHSFELRHSDFVIVFIRVIRG
ncbi:MAG TPA: hypothetical protein VGM65_12295 [Candidatus Udaeobacter sp.]